MMTTRFMTARTVAVMLASLLTSSVAISQAPADDPAPFPPGQNALLVKQTCSQCHSPNLVVNHTFTKLSARKIYQTMMGESPDTERGQKIVDYLYKVMGDKDDE